MIALGAGSSTSRAVWMCPALSLSLVERDKCGGKPSTKLKDENKEADPDHLVPDDLVHIPAKMVLGPVTNGRSDPVSGLIKSNDFRVVIAHLRDNECLENVGNGEGKVEPFPALGDGGRWQSNTRKGLRKLLVVG